MADVQPKWDATRVFIIVIVVLFIVSSFAISIGVIMELMRGDSSSTTADQTTKIEPQEGKLQGSKLEGFEPISSVDKLEVIDIKEGEGEVVAAGATVTAHYTGAIAADGTIFQSSKDMGQPATFPLQGVIKGWQDGVPGMKVGGVRRLVIPADQAYGATPPQGSGIPANAPLVFDIELVSLGE